MEDIEKEIAGEDDLNDIVITHEGKNNHKEENNHEEEDNHEEDSHEEINEEKEDDTIKYHNRGSNNDKKRSIIIIILIVVAIILIGVILVLALGKKETSKKEKEEEETKEVVKEEEKEEVGANVSYVSCDDNTTLLNVRNSASGDIIDGLSCYKEVKVLEEIGSTDNCDKWYRVSYDKRGNSYTGYVCAQYIKDSISDSTSIKKMRKTIDAANEYFEENKALVYCGETNGTKTVQINEDGHSFDGQYAKSEFKTIDELKSHILTFLDESLINIKLELSDYNNPKMYDNFYEIDGNLYCRDYSGKGWLTFYTGTYDIEVVNETDSKVELKVSYEYLDEEKLTDDSNCGLNTLSNCSNGYFKYIIKNVTLSKDNNTYKVTKIDFHE